MKIKIRNILIALLGVLFVFTACKKEEPVKLDPQMNTWKVRNITSTSAELSGIIVAEDSEDSHSCDDCPRMVEFKEYGVCWNTAENPTVSNSKVSMTKHPKAVYWVTAENLEHLTTYYARAYAIDKNGKIRYGEQTDFTTLANVPYISAEPASSVTGKSATITSNLTADGKSEVTEKGICWSKKENPTVEDTVIKADNVDLGAYTITIENLEGNTTYYARAYAINKIGTAYSKQIMFTTDVASPTLTTDSIENVTINSFDVYGTLAANGGSTVTEMGFCWGVSENPEITSSNKTPVSIDEKTPYKYNATIEGLALGTEYYVRAYAQNSEGVAYGKNIKVKTEGIPTQMFITGSPYDWKWDKAYEMIPVNSHEGWFWAIQYFDADASIKFNQKRAWDGTEFGAENADARTFGDVPVGGSDLKIQNAGFHLILIKCSVSAGKVVKTIELQEPKVYLFGNTSPAGWTAASTGLFTLSGDEYVSPAFIADDEIRVCVKFDGADWWQSEFIVLDGKIAYRGNGGDQERVRGTAGQKIKLNFKDDTGSIVD